MVDKISTEYDITQQQKTRSHRRERGSAGSLAPTPEIARTHHAFPAILWCLRINVGLCLPLPSTAHSDQCLLCAAVWVVASCPLIVVPLCLVLVDQSYDLVVIDGSSLYKSFTEIGISTPFLANSPFKVRSAGLFARIFLFNSFDANTRMVHFVRENNSAFFFHRRVASNGPVECQGHVN